MEAIKRWESKALGCWQKAKELRLNFYKEFITANQEGKIVNVACGLVPQALIAGFGDFVHLQGEPYGASCGFEKIGTATIYKYG